jgi:tetratricopeptide (TPR) repeat protein
MRIVAALLFLTIGFRVAAAAELDRAALLARLSVPKQALNLDVSFSNRELRPQAADPKADIRDAADKIAAGKEDAPLCLHLADVLAQVGRTDEADREYSRAADLYETIVNANPKDWDAHLQYGLALSGAGREGEALTQFATAGENDPKQWRAMIELADGLTPVVLRARDAGDMDAVTKYTALAKEVAERAVQAAPDRPEPYISRFMANWLSRTAAPPSKADDAFGDVAGMAADLHKAADKAPQYAKLRLTAYFMEMVPELAACASTDDFTGALQRLPQGLRDSLPRIEDGLAKLTTTPDVAEPCWILLGIISYFKGDEPQAAERLQKALDADPKGTRALELQLGFAMSKKDWPSVDKLLDTLLKRADNGRTRCWAGRVAAQKGDYAAAEAAYRVAQTKPDAFADACLGLGVSILKRGGDANEAVIVLRKAVEAAGGNADAHQALAVALALAGEREEARQSIAQAAKLAPDDANIKAIQEALAK